MTPAAEQRLAASGDLTWAHALRSMACALVVLVHANIYLRLGTENWWPGGDYSVPPLSLVVPLFFLLSGFFSVNLSGSAVPVSLWRYLQRKLRRLAVPFLFWGVVLLALGVEVGDGSWLQMGFALLTGPWQLYYLFVLSQFFVLGFYLERNIRPPRLDAILGVAAALTVLSYVVSELHLWWLGAGQEHFEIWARRAFPCWSLFFVTGVWLRWRAGAVTWLMQKAGRLSLVGALSYGLYVWEIGLEGQVFGYHPRLQLLLGGLPFQIVGSLSVVAGLLHLQSLPGPRKALVWIAAGAQDSFGIYLSHTAALIVLIELWLVSGISTAHWMGVPVATVLVWLVCQTAVKVVRRWQLRHLGFLAFGMRIHRTM